MCSKIIISKVKKYLISFLSVFCLSIQDASAQVAALEEANLVDKSAFVDRVYHISVGIVLFSMYIFFTSIILYFIRDDEAIKEKAIKAIVISIIVFVVGAVGWIVSR